MNPYLDILVSVCLGVPICFAVAAIFRYTSCWNRLERHYLTQSYDPVEHYPMQWINIVSPFDPSGFFNNFHWSIKVGAGSEGVFLSAIRPFHLILRPILIPWEDAIIGEQQFILFARNELMPAKVPEVQFLLSGALMEKLESARSNANLGKLVSSNSSVVGEHDKAMDDK